MTNIAKQFRDRHPGANVVRRTRNAIHVETAPGKFVAEIHMRPIHRLDGGEIDTAWIADSGTYQHQMALADYKAQAKAAFNGAPLVRYEHVASGQWVTLQPRQLDYSNDRNDVQMISAVQSVTATVDDDTLTWAGAYGAGRDFKWQASTDLLAKELILQTAAAAPEPSAQVLGGANPILRLAYTFAFSSGISIFIDGVQWNGTSTVTTFGAIEFRDAASNVLWSFAVPQVTDAAGNMPTGVVQRLSKSGPNLLCEVRVPWSWLQSAAYPVVIDPTLVLQPDETASADVRLWQGDANGNYNDTQLTIGNNNGATLYFNSLLKFDLTSIPTTATVDSAALLLTKDAASGTTSYNVAAHKILRAWVEAQATWNSYSTGNAWGTAGCNNTTTDREATGEDMQLLAMADTSKTWNIPIMAQAWVTNPASNHGVWFGTLDAHTGIGLWYAASSGKATASVRPKFTVNYTEAAAPNAPSNLVVAQIS